jgi:hypothetical protein
MKSDIGNVTKRTIATIFAFLSTTAVYPEIYNYSCKACVFGDNHYNGCDVADGRRYLLRVDDNKDDNKNVLEWRGKKFALTEQPNCGKYGWHAEGNGTSFDFCTATQGYGAIEDEDSIKSDAILRGDRSS